jgi:peptide/nickel transport system substrate-binding protein
MRSSIAAGSRPRFAFWRATLAAVVLLAPTFGLAGGARGAETDLVLKVGTDQKLETLNPWHSVTVADYEIFQVQYELLVSFGNDLSPAPGFADTWESSTDGMTHTFHIRSGMKWSDGEPATCEDARWTYQFVLDVVASDAGYVGSGYLEPYLTNAGLKSVKCEGENLVATTEFPTTLLTQAYIPILPKHIWDKYTMDQIGNAEAKGFFKNEPPVVGSGPYVAVEWEPGQFIRMARNPNYWGEPGPAKEIIFQTFATEEAMVTALRNGEIDYVRGTGPDQFDALKTEPNIRVSEGYANGYSYLSFNTHGNDEGYGGSTSALKDPKFRDALGYAIDRQKLVDSVLNGHGVVGSTIVPPYHVNFHVEPTTPRSFNIAEANSRLDAAGYPRGADGIRTDKEGKPINLRMTWPDSEDHQADALFIKDWWGQVGVGVDAFVTEEGKLIDDLYGKEAGGDSKWDTYMWGWVGDPDPMSLIADFTTDNLESGLNDCFFSNPRYDELFLAQQRAVDLNTRKADLAEMQNIFYDAACTHVLYYDSELHAQRTDKFTNWVNQPPDTGTPLFGYGYSGYMSLTDASLVPTPGPTTVATTGPVATGGGAATPAPTQAPTTGTTGALSTPVLIGAVIAIIVIVGGFLMLRRRGATTVDV